MNVKLIATDMDGTLLNSKKEKPEDFIPWVKAHPQYRVVIASGRQYRTLLADFEDAADDLIFIAENGAFVFEKGECIHSDAMDPAAIRACLDIAKTLPGVTPVLCGKESAYMENVPEYIKKQALIYFVRMEYTDDLYACAERDAIAKVALFVDGDHAADLFGSLPAPPEGVSPVLSGICWIDLANASVNKGVALTAVRERFGIPREECMAFGDFLNDRALILACGESYVMANGHPEMKAIAKHIAPSNDDDGVMKILRTLG